MGLYTWRVVTDPEIQIDVVRSFREYEQPPTEEELLQAGLPVHAEYERIIGASSVRFADGWGTGPNNRAKGGGH
jgi:hypothetical protein